MPKKLVIKRTVTITSTVPINDDTYPEMSIDEAVAYEQDMDITDKLEHFAEAVSCADFDGHKATLTEEITVEDVSDVEDTSDVSDYEDRPAGE